MGKRPHTRFGGGSGRRSEDSAHTWRSRLATNGLHAGSSPAQSTRLILSLKEKVNEPHSGGAKRCMV